MLFNLILLFLSSFQINQEKYLGSIQRLSPEINKLIDIEAKIEIIAEGFDWSEGPVWSKNGQK